MSLAKVNACLLTSKSFTEVVCDSNRAAHSNNLIQTILLYSNFDSSSMEVKYGKKDTR